MFNNVRNAFVGAVAVLGAGLVGLPAAAATYSGTGWSGSDPSCTSTGSSANNWSTIDVLAGATFNSEFADSDAGGNMCFNFFNSSTTAAVVTFAVATVNQGGSFWGFTGGVTLASEQLGTLWTVAQGVFDSESFTFTIAANSSIFFDWTYGDPYGANANVNPDIDFTVYASPVPLPAGGLLLIGALGGLALLRRRNAA